MEDNRIIIQDGDGQDISFYVLEETKINGHNYILVTDSDEGEDGECYILKDVSCSGEEDAVYEFVEDDNEAESIFNVFTELMEDSDMELSK